MQPAISLPRRLFVIACWIVVIGVYALAIMPGREAPSLGYGDKMNHMAAFFAVTFLARLAYVRRSVWMIAALIATFGAVIELTQMLPVIGRDGEFSDWVADMIAMVAALIVAWPLAVLIRRYRVRQWALRNLPQPPPA